MEHRRFLAHPEAHHPFVGSDLLMRIGGGAAVETIVDRLYDRIDADAVLRPLFGRDLTNERAAQMRFFAEWLGGETCQLIQGGHSGRRSEAERARNPCSVTPRYGFWALGLRPSPGMTGQSLAAHAS